MPVAALILLYFRCHAVNSSSVAHNQQKQKRKDESNWAVNQKQCPLIGVATLRVETDMIYSWLCLLLVLSSRTWWNVWQLYSPEEGVNDWEQLGVVLKWAVESISWFFGPGRLTVFTRLPPSPVIVEMKSLHCLLLHFHFEEFIWPLIKALIHYLGADGDGDITFKYIKWRAAFFLQLGYAWKCWFVPGTRISLF